MIDVHFAQWTSVEHREEVHEKIQKKVRYLFFLGRAQIKDGGNGRTVQQKSQGRKEICG